jgi:glycosyltransferase involved in cell wall biosynthesis
VKRVSFVIPYFNDHWVTHAIESAQKQTYGNVEIVVVDDGSTDQTWRGVSYMAESDKRIKFVRLAENVGRSEARNIGNAAASGDIICVLDADDCAYPDRAKLTVEKMKKADVVYGSADQMDLLGNKGGLYQADVFNLSNALREKQNKIVHSTMAYSKDLATRFKYRGGDISRLGIDDWCFQLELAQSGARFEHIHQPIGAYRENPSGISKTRDPKEVARVKDAFLEGFLVKA